MIFEKAFFSQKRELFLFFCPLKSKKGLILALKWDIYKKFIRKFGKGLDKRAEKW